MQVLFFYFSVMLLKDVMNSGAEEITDLSDWCMQGRVIDFYLTTGAGHSDVKISMIASEEHVNCTLIFKVRPQNFIMLVVEYPDKSPEERVCFSQSSNSVLIRDYNKTHICQEDGKKNVYYGSSKDSVSVVISCRSPLNTVKLTATSMRDTLSMKCSESDELECVYNHTLYCMTTTVLCDGHINCAIDVDEDELKCKDLTLTFVAIVCTVCMGTVTFALIACAAYTIIPTRKEVFIQTGDQSLSLFDSDDIGKSEIHIRELIPIVENDEDSGDDDFDDFVSQKD